jgi:hypothetical protein
MVAAKMRASYEAFEWTSKGKNMQQNAQIRRVFTHSVISFQFSDVSFQMVRDIENGLQRDEQTDH